MFLQKKRTPLQATRLFTGRTAADSRLSPALGTIQALGREEEAEKVKPYLEKACSIPWILPIWIPNNPHAPEQSTGRDLFSNCLQFPLEKSGRILYLIVFRT